MNNHNPGYEFSPQTNKNENLAFADKFQDLLPGIEFEESNELVEARTAVLEALTRSTEDADFLRSVWIEYDKICEQIVDKTIDTNSQVRARLQIAVLVHKALIFREAGNKQRYSESLSVADEYAYNMSFEEIAEKISAELDRLAN